MEDRAMTTVQNEFGPNVAGRVELRLLEAARHTDEFLATLGHEIRNPLSALSNALHLWSTEVLDSTELAEIRELMHRQVQQLRRLSDDLLDSARITRGAMEIHRQEATLQQLIPIACEQVRPLIDGYGHVLTVELPAKPLAIWADSTRLVQVFANLLQNAAKFTSGPGDLKLTVDEREGRAVVQVRDNGRGIEAHMLSTIFEAYAQVRESQPTNNGLGIGLRLVKTIVELHAGKVSARSDGLGCGSEFIVELPLMKQQQHNS
jgi:signal transduction histidine kinase